MIRRPRTGQRVQGGQDERVACGYWLIDECDRRPDPDIVTPDATLPGQRDRVGRRLGVRVKVDRSCPPYFPPDYLISTACRARLDSLSSVLPLCRRASTGTMAKKRKSTPQAATLHDFFGKPGRVPQKKVKVEPTLRTPIKCVDPGEIIVIDSDDDDRPKASKATPAPDGRGAAPAGESSFGLPLLLTQEDKSRDSEPPSSFGTPSLLVGFPGASSTQTPSKTGGAAPLDGCTPPPVSKTPSREGPSNTLEDEWRTGDDEMEMDEVGRSTETQEEDAVDIDLTLDEDAVDIDLTLDDADDPPPPSPSGNARTCPLCDKRLVGLSDMVCMPLAHSCSCCSSSTRKYKNM